MSNNCRSFLLKATGLTLLFGMHLFFINSAALSQSISGTVTDAQSGEPLPGVNVIVEGTTTGTSTDIDGAYELNVSSLQDTLAFSFVGYQKQEVAIQGRTSIDVNLQSQAVTGEEMVVIGYGTQQEQDVTGSVESIDMESIENTPPAAANERLAGKISGVQVNSTQGIPGGGPEIKIRGVSAIGAGGAPLYVIDGFPLPQGAGQITNPLNQIKSSDIKSMSVLKGPSATAIYGSRASNGVIIIETKEGREGTFEFNIDMNTGWQSIPDQEVIPMMNAKEFATFMKQSVEDQNRVKNQNEPIPEDYQDPSQYGEGTDWFKELTRVAPRQNIHISASGGNEKINSYLSAGYRRDEGVVLGTNYNQISFRSNINANITENLSLGVNFNPTYSYGNNPVRGGLGRNSFQFGNWTTLSPIPSVYNDDGSYNKMIGTDDTFNYPNPVMGLEQSYRRQTTTRILGNGYVAYDLTKGLTIRSSVNADLYYNNQDNFTPSTIGGLNAPPPSIPTGYYGSGRYLNWSNENRVTFERTFADDHKVKVMGNFSLQQQLDNSGGFTGDEYVDDAVRTLNVAPKITGSSSATSWTLVSYLGRLNYSFKNRYLVTVTARRDGSSRFGKNTRWGTFPSFAVGWNISNEPWMNNVDWLSNLKIRAAYGKSGNNQIGNFDYVGQLTEANYILGNSIAGGRKFSRISNPNLKWEKTSAVNLGIDMGLLKNRINITAELYKSTTEDLLLNLNVPESSGFSSSLQNIGQIENKGFEIQVKSDNIVTNDFTWSTNINFSLNRNKALDLGHDTEIKSGNSMEGHYTHITKEGEPIGQFFGYNFLGLYTPDEIEDSEVPKFSGAIPGNMKVEDVNRNGKIDTEEDFTVIGNPHPDFTYGVSTALNYKSFTLSAAFTGSYGAERLKMNYSTLHNIDGVFNVPKEMKKRYRSPDEPGDGRHPTTAGPGQGRVMYRDVSSLNVFNASYFWLRNITIGYELPESIMRGYLGRVKVYGSIDNAFIITSYPNGNPATTSYNTDSDYGGALAPGVDNTSYPTPRVFSVGININI